MSFLLHANYWHLGSNLYFLWRFGDNAEDCLGPLGFLLLVVCATVTGDALHIATDPRSDVPLIGASGGISGVMVYYALRFPHARLDFIAGWGLFFRRVRAAAWVYVLIWILIQVPLAVLQMYGYSMVSTTAHFGGALVGALFAFPHRVHRWRAGIIERPANRSRP